MPILDVQRPPFVDLINAAGVRDYRRRKKFLRLRGRIVEGGGSALRCPSYRFAPHLRVDFEHPLVGRQVLNPNALPKATLKCIAPARTFGLRIRTGQNAQHVPDPRRRLSTTPSCFDRTSI